VLGDLQIDDSCTMFQSQAVTELSEGGARQQKRKAGAVEGGGESAVNKMLWSLDNRLRHIEGKIPSFFLAASDNVVVPAMIAANKAYDELAVKGAAHPHGARRTSLAAGFLNRVSEADVTKVDGEAATFATHCDQIAQMTKTLSLAEQQTLLIHLLKSFDTAQKMESEVAACMFFKCKKQSKDTKEDRYFFALELQPSSYLVHCHPLIRLVLMGAKAKLADGPPPQGPLIRNIPRK
jgi:hypothetical protein